MLDSDAVSSRYGFIRQVFMIVSVQLLIPIAITAPFVFTEAAKNFLLENPSSLYISIAIFVIAYIALLFCPIKRMFPLNLIFLTFLMVSLGFMAAVISARHSTRTVLSALILITVWCICTVFLPSNAVFDTNVMAKASGWCGCTFIMIVQIGASVLVLWLMGMKWMHTVYTLIGVGIFTMYLVCGTYMILAGRPVELEDEEYIAGAIYLYIAMMYIPVFIWDCLKGTD